MALNRRQHDQDSDKPRPVSLSNFVETMDACLDTVAKTSNDSMQFHAIAEAFRLTLATIRAILEEDGDQFFILSPGESPKAKRVDGSPVDIFTSILKHYHIDRANFFDSVICYRVGDFYEFIYDDAIIASRELHIALTVRNFDIYSSIPICGIPSYASKRYFTQLFEKDYKVTVIDKLHNRQIITTTSTLTNTNSISC